MHFGLDRYFTFSMEAIFPFSNLDNYELLSYLSQDGYRSIIDTTMIFMPLMNYLNDTYSVNGMNVVNDSELCTYSIEQFKNILDNENRISNFELSLIHANVRSLNSRLDEFEAFVQYFNESIDVFILSEIWSTNILFFNNILPGYTFIADLAISSNVGGLGIFLKKTFEWNERKDLKIASDTQNQIENIWLEIKRLNKTFLIGGMYRHPSRFTEDFSQKLEVTLNKIVSDSRDLPCIIATDANLDFFKFETNQATKGFIDSLLMHNFSPMIFFPTRIADTSATLIDHIYYHENKNSNYNVRSGNLLYEFADHLTNYFILSKNSHSCKFHDYKNRPVVRTYNKKGYDNLKIKLIDYDWGNLLLGVTDVNDCYKKIESELQIIHDQCFPLKKTIT